MGLCPAGIEVDAWQCDWCESTVIQPCGSRYGMGDFKIAKVHGGMQGAVHRRPRMIEEV